MTDQLLNVLKIAFLALLYLFFMRVLWVVAGEVRAGRSGANAQLAAQAPTTAEPMAVPAPVQVPAGGPVPPPVAASRPVKSKRRDVGRLVIIEPRSARGTTFALSTEITLGRAPGCTVSITDDPFISNLHARVFVAPDGSAIAEDLGSTNGTYLNGGRLSDARPMHKGDRLQLGKTVLEAR
jgi:hypothetical protein